MSTSITQFVNPPAPVVCFAYNKDRTMIAISANSEKVFIYRRNGANWDTSAPAFVLAEHDKLVTGIDWAPESNRIVTCSQDRNAYVWSFEDGVAWRPKLVLLRINRAATCVRWSPDERKIAVASGARTISICYFQPQHDWWACRHIKKPIRSTILSLDWHPNSVLVAAGCADFTVRVFFAGIKEVETARPEPTPWGSKLSFDTCYHEFRGACGTSACGWVHSVKFSPDGNTLAWVSHSSSVHFVTSDEGATVQTVNFNGLPQRSVIWASDNSVIAGGHDANIHLFTRGHDGQWAYVRPLDATEKKSSSAGPASGASAAMNMFRQLDSRGQQETDTSLPTVHQNAITQLSPYESSGSRVTAFASSGLDGKVVVWSINSIESSMAGLKIA
ncbi:hypothetical protein H696_04417 [Fonticula alba]|uniref:Actin-related protein 2/3 complex subunit n=1 Tax=Fonticula alba TaxID=691883 RepID=A0A058Z677_FONAL|nr:hypothetical protein H696_04417 [Fonticula alba]KCV68997.1 hypothetical protein H696_04417 [Fonticula alba]|eukprot:XP_009496568.1 hypothetical protein H696_04417 [Fonticula alba]